jgi:PAS domain S-box-containing protein
MSYEAAAADDYRILLLAPTRRDADVTCGLLERTEIICVVCEGCRALAAGIERGVGAILLTDAAFHDPHIEEVVAVLERQAPWSDVPAILLCRTGIQSRIASRILRSLHNVTVLERPTSSRTLVSSLKAALRARERQYQMREQFKNLLESESALRLRERQLHSVAENTPDMLVRFDRNLRHVFVNQAATRALGLKEEDFMGRTARELGLTAEFCDMTEPVLREVFSTGRQRTMDLEFHGPEGLRYYWSLLVPEVDEAGSVETVLAVSHDVTASKQAEQALQTANRRKDEFLAMLAHELRNPLAPIRNASEILSRKLPADPQIQTTVGIVKRQTLQLTRLVDDLLDVSRITEGRIELRREPLDVSAIVAQAVETVEPLIRERGHTMLVGSIYEPVYVEGDHVRLVQCIANILTNAAKYTDPGGEIRLEVRTQDTTVVIAISDSGIGIPAELLPQIFELFVQGDRSLDRSQGGLGIGLSVVRRLIEMHKGRVFASSAGAGRGSMFEIHLPLIPAPIEEHEEVERSAMQPRRILIVDDNADAADSLALLLKLEGHETEAVYGARDALDRAASLRPDVVLLDIGLPEMSGYELAALIRSMLGSVRLIAVTGYGQREDIERARSSGFDGHVIKPVDCEMLGQMIGESFESRRPEQVEH